MSGARRGEQRRPPNQITITEKGEYCLPRVLELAKKGMTAKAAFDQADAEWEAKEATKQ